MLLALLPHVYKQTGIVNDVQPRKKAELDRHVGIFIDLQGPQIRINRFAGGEANLEVIVRWDWRMLHAFGQYYLQDNPGLDQVYQVARARFMAFATENGGLMIRGEYMRQYTSKDASLLMGPIYLF